MGQGIRDCWKSCAELTVAGAHLEAPHNGPLLLQHEHHHLARGQAEQQGSIGEPQGGCVCQVQVPALRPWRPCGSRRRCLLQHWARAHQAQVGLQLHTQQHSCTAPQPSKVGQGPIETPMEVVTGCMLVAYLSAWRCAEVEGASACSANSSMTGVMPAYALALTAKLQDAPCTARAFAVSLLHACLVSKPAGAILQQTWS